MVVCVLYVFMANVNGSLARGRPGAVAVGSCVVSSTILHTTTSQSEERASTGQRSCPCARIVAHMHGYPHALVMCALEYYHSASCKSGRVTELES
jgi:hypothetical protein